MTVTSSSSSTANGGGGGGGGGGNAAMSSHTTSPSTNTSSSSQSQASTSSSQHSQSLTAKPQELVALVSWLQTFPVFTLKIIDGKDGEIAADTVIESLSSLQASRSIWKVAEEICGNSDPELNKVFSNPDEIWTNLLILTSTRARPLATDHTNKAMSPADLKLYVLSNLLDCAVQCPDLDQRRAYIQRIMGLSKIVQKTLMGLIERRNQKNKKVNNSGGAGVAASSSSSAANTNKKKPSTPHPSSAALLKSGSASSPSIPNNNNGLARGGGASSLSSTAMSRVSALTAKSNSSSTAAPPPPAPREPHHQISSLSSQHSRVIQRPPHTSTQRSGSNGRSHASDPSNDNRLSQGSAYNGSSSSSPSTFNDSSPYQTPTKTGGAESSTATSRIPRPVSSRSPSGLTPNPKRRSSDANNTMLSPGTMESPQQIQSIVADLRRRNEQMSKLMDSYKDREDVLIRELDEAKANHRKQMMKWESAAMDREQELHESYKNNIRQLEQELGESQKQIEQGKAAMRELQMARDEIEIYQHNRSVLSETTEKLRKYKEKVAELQDVKEALQREQDAHSQSVEEVIRLENELQSLQGVKRQLEEYKIRAIEAEVKLVECQDYLRRMEAKASESSATNDYLWKGAVMQKEQMEELRRRIQDETQAAMERANGLGEGVSEFNPEIMDELIRLRNENVHLRSFASKRENDAVEKMESDLDDTRRLADRYKNEFLATKEKLDNTQMALDESQKRADDLSIELDSWKQRWDDADRQRRMLEQQLEQTQRDLDETSGMLQESERRCELLETTLDDMTKRAQEAEKESATRYEMWQDAQNQCETTTADLESAGNQIAELRETMRGWERRSREMEDLQAKMEHELEESQENLMNVRVKLGDFERRNQDLSHKIDVLKEEKSELQQAVEREKQSKNDLMEECHRSLEATREVLMAKSKKEIEEMQGNMNCLLDDERRASRRKDEEYQRRMEQLENKWKRDYEELQERLSSTLKNSRQEAQDRIDFIKAEYENEIEKTRKEAAEERDNLITKGKCMLDDQKQKSKHELTQMDEYCNELEEKMSTLEKEKEDTEKMLRSKVVSLTQQRDYTASQVNDLTEQNDELQETLRSKERENMKLVEDNDRFRRQLGGRFGTDGKLQAQHEKLQKEYNSLLEEHRTLKNRVGRNALAGIDESDEFGGGGGRGGATRSSLSQIRREYEEAIERLNDEKRELIMKHSAAATDVQKAEQRAWERDQENSKLKAQLTSMQLKLSRMDYNNSQPRDYRDETSSPETGNNNEEIRDLPENNSKHNMPYGSSSFFDSSSQRLDSSRRSSPSLDRAMNKKAEQENNLRNRLALLTGLPEQQASSSSSSSFLRAAPRTDFEQLSPVNNNKSSNNFNTNSFNTNNFNDNYAGGSSDSPRNNNRNSYGGGSCDSPKSTRSNRSNKSNRSSGRGGAFDYNNNSNNSRPSAYVLTSSDVFGLGTAATTTNMSKPIPTRSTITTATSAGAGNFGPSTPQQQKTFLDYLSQDDAAMSRVDERPECRQS